MGEWLAIGAGIFVLIVALKRIHLHKWSRWSPVAYTEGGDVIQERRCESMSCRLTQRKRGMW